MEQTMGLDKETGDGTLVLARQGMYKQSTTTRYMVGTNIVQQDAVMLIRTPLKPLTVNPVGETHTVGKRYVSSDPFLHGWLQRVLHNGM